MKRIIPLALIALFLIPAFAFSEEEADTSMGMGMMHKEMKQADKEGMVKKHLKAGMMSEMMKKQMVATSDGGVVVLYGNKLLKYDKKLDLVKEAEIKMDFEQMKMMKKKWIEGCEKRKETMEEKASEIEEAQEVEEAVPAE